MLLPHPTIQAPVLNRFRQVLLANMLRAVEIGNRPRDFEDTAVAARGEAEALGDQFEEAVTGFVRFAMFTDQAGRHLGVTVNAAVAEALFLNRAAGFYSQGNHFRRFGVGTIDKIAIFDRRDFVLDVDTVEEGAGDSGAIALNNHRRAGAGVGRVGKITTGTGVRVPFPTFSTNSVLAITSQSH